MAMETPEHPLSYKEFAKRCRAVTWNNAWGRFGISRGMREIFAVIILLAGASGLKLLTPKEESVTLWWIGLAPVGIWLSSYLWYSAKAPHDVYLELEQKRQLDVAEEKSRSDAVAKELKTTEAKIETDETKAAKRKAIGDQLGRLKNEIYDWRQTVIKMKFWGYNEKYPNIPYNQLDQDTSEIIQRIASFLDATYSTAEASAFASQLDVKRKQNPYQDISSSQWWDAVTILEHYERQLEKIIELKHLRE